MARIHAPVTSFGQELHDALRRGSNVRFEITFDNEKMAIRFNQRLNALRNAMKKENHPDWIQLYRCQARREGKLLILAPADSEFRGALVAAGLDKISEPPTVKSVNIETPTPDTVSLDSFFSELVDATTIDSEPEPGLDKL